MRLRQIAFALAAATLPTTALAWNAQGHQGVGAVADRMIAGTRAEQWVHALLGERNLQTVSVWADCAKATKSADDLNFVYQANPKYAECNAFDTPDDKAGFESFVARNWKQCGTVHGTEYCHNQYHYADVSSLHDHYDPAYAGTNNHDVVHAINAAIAVLRDQTPETPFSFADKREALMLLTHYVGDIHQPLHVTALYLNDKGEVVDPDRTGYKLGQDTAGGNNIVDDKKLFHGEWDTPPADLLVDGAPVPKLMKLAQAVPTTKGDVANWSTAWASDSVKLAPQVFGGLHFTMRPPLGSDVENYPEKWDVAGIDAAYQAKADEIKLEQIAKAGARLAQLLEAIWPQSTPAPDTAK
ncbi:MAG: S1/P1 nuclease [Burkholderiaceae bacterium]|nr:S1/P1 nuclease [Burkholderiaceae bacterium]